MRTEQLVLLIVTGLLIAALVYSRRRKMSPPSPPNEEPSPPQPPQPPVQCPIHDCNSVVTSTLTDGGNTPIPAYPNTLVSNDASGQTFSFVTPDLDFVQGEDFSAGGIVAITVAPGVNGTNVLGLQITDFAQWFQNPNYSVVTPNDVCPPFNAGGVTDGNGDTTWSVIFAAVRKWLPIPITRTIDANTGVINVSWACAEDCETYLVSAEVTGEVVLAANHVVEFTRVIGTDYSQPRRREPIVPNHIVTRVKAWTNCFVDSVSFESQRLNNDGTTGGNYHKFLYASETCTTCQYPVDGAPVGGNIVLANDLLPTECIIGCQVDTFVEPMTSVRYLSRVGFLVGLIAEVLDDLQITRRTITFTGSTCGYPETAVPDEVLFPVGYALAGMVSTTTGDRTTGLVLEVLRIANEIPIQTGFVTLPFGTAVDTDQTNATITYPPEFFVGPATTVVKVVGVRNCDSVEALEVRYGVTQ